MGCPAGICNGGFGCAHLELEDAEKLIFQNSYSSEALSDVERDIMESLDPRFNDVMKDIPQDQYGLHSGEFEITIKWKPTDDDLVDEENTDDLLEEYYEEMKEPMYFGEDMGILVNADSEEEAFELLSKQIVEDGGDPIEEEGYIDTGWVRAVTRREKKENPDWTWMFEYRQDPKFNYRQVYYYGF